MRTPAETSWAARDLRPGMRPSNLAAVRLDRAAELGSEINGETADSATKWPDAVRGEERRTRLREREREGAGPLVGRLSGRPARPLPYPTVRSVTAGVLSRVMGHGPASQPGRCRITTCRSRTQNSCASLVAQSRVSQAWYS